MSLLVLSGLVFAFGTSQLLLPGGGPDLDFLVKKGYDGLESGAAGTEDFRIALRLDPASPYRWCDLGESLLQTGDPVLARYCFGRAVELAPHVPPVLLRSAHFQLMAGSDGEAMQSMARILHEVATYDDLIFHYYGRIGSGTQEVLTRGIPADRRPAQAYFRYRLRQPDVLPDDLRVAWAWLAARGYTDENLANEYIATLGRFPRGRP